MAEGRRLHVRIHGVVQGVGFRYSTLQRARRLGLSGYVRNDRDGSVEVVAEGPEEDLKRLLKWLEKGPTGAHVRRLDKNMSEPRGEFDGFTVAH